MQFSSYKKYQFTLADTACTPPHHVNNKHNDFQQELPIMARTFLAAEFQLQKARKTRYFEGNLKVVFITTIPFSHHS